MLGTVSKVKFAHGQQPGWFCGKLAGNSYARAGAVHPTATCCHQSRASPMPAAAPLHVSVEEVTLALFHTGTKAQRPYLQS